MIPTCYKEHLFSSLKQNDKSNVTDMSACVSVCPDEALNWNGERKLDNKVKQVKSRQNYAKIINIHTHL